MHVCHSINLRNANNLPATSLHSLPVSACFAALPRLPNRPAVRCLDRTQARPKNKKYKAPVLTFMRHVATSSSSLDARRPLIFHSASWPFLLTSITTTKTMTSHPDTKIDCSKVYVKKSTFSNEETGDFDGAFAAVAIKEGEFWPKVPKSPPKHR